MISSLLASLGLGGLTFSGLVASVFPWIASITGAGGVAAWFAGKFMPANFKLYAKAAAIALVVVAVFTAGFWLKSLIDRSAKLRTLESQIAATEQSQGCYDRHAGEHDLFVCLAAQRADVERAKAEAEAANASAAASAQEALDAANNDIDAIVDAEIAAARAAIAADNGPLPKVLVDSWKRERARLGVR